MKRIIHSFFSIVALCWIVSNPVAYADDNILRLATTTSTENSGLLAKLIPVFSERYGVTVHTIAVATGRALSHARNGDVDIVLVHARNAELELVQSGYGINRKEIMYNEFVIAGPDTDPARIGSLMNLADAFRKIAESASLFVSRGDDSGTHKKELSVWAKHGIKPEGSWYREVGLGMGRALQIADELRAYILTDKGTWLALKKQLSLPIHVQGADDGRNVYGIIAVNPQKHPHATFAAAEQLIEWIQSDEAKSLISAHPVDGEQLLYVID